LQRKQTFTLSKRFTMHETGDPIQRQSSNESGSSRASSKDRRLKKGKTKSRLNVPQENTDSPKDARRKSSKRETSSSKDARSVSKDPRPASGEDGQLQDALPNSQDKTGSLKVEPLNSQGKRWLTPRELARASQPDSQEKTKSTRDVQPSSHEKVASSVALSASDNGIPPPGKFQHG